MALPDFISDADMAAFETPSPSGGSGSSTPDFISDDQLHVYEGTQAPSREAPSFFSDPIGSIAGTSNWGVENLIPNLTSSDFWLTRPSGETITAKQGIVGPLQSALGGMTLGMGDEIIAGGSAIGDALLGGPGYDARLAEARAIDKSYEEASPIGSLITSGAGALKTPLLNLATKTGALLPAAKTLPQAALRTGALTAALAGEGALYSGAYGFGEGEGGLQNRLSSAKEGAETGATISAILGAPLTGISELSSLYSKQISDLSGKLFRKSTGARASDYAKSAKELDSFDITDDQVKTATSEALDALQGRGLLGTNSEKNLVNVLKEERKLGSRIDTIIKTIDKGDPQAYPDFENALDYLIKGKVPANQVDKYLDDLEKLSGAIKDHGKGKLSYLQQQKIAAGSKYNPDDGAANGFWRAVYSDLQKTVEKHAPDVGPLNSQLRDVKITKPIFQRALGKEESSNFVDALFERLRTSGAKTIMGPAVGATAMFGFGAGLPAAAAAGVAGHFMTPKGQQQLAKSLAKIAKNTNRPLSAFEKLIPSIGHLSGKQSAQDPTSQNIQQSPIETKKTGLNQKISELPSSNYTTDSSTRASFKDDLVDRAYNIAEGKIMEGKTPKIVEEKKVEQELPKNIFDMTLEQAVNTTVPESEKFLSKVEGGQQLKAYPPPAKGSGVTVATGVDLGQHSKEDLERMGVSSKTIQKVHKYLGKKDATARLALKEKPLELKKEEAEELDNAVKNDIFQTVDVKFKNATGQSLEKLPPEAQTVVKSLAYNFGKNFDKKIPTIWKAIVKKDWTSLQSLLQTTKWKQPELKSRRIQEAKLLDNLTRIA